MQTIGRKGENLAVDYLIKQGYHILVRNYRFKKSELDIICEHDNLLVFIEVKTRSSRTFGEPESFVSESQRNSIIRGAEEYILEINWQGDIRFDIVAIIQTTTEQEVFHLKDAFY